MLQHLVVLGEVVYLVLYYWCFCRGGQEGSSLLRNQRKLKCLIWLGLRTENVLITLLVLCDIFLCL